MFHEPRLDRARTPCAWTEDALQPYIEAATRWLDVVDGARARTRHEVRVEVIEGHLPAGDDGCSWLYPYGIEQCGDDLLPTRGAITTSARLHDTHDARRYASVSAWRDERMATLVHEMGHILGIGLLWNLRRCERGIVRDDTHPTLRHWVRMSADHQGAIYQQPAGVRAYNDLVGDGDGEFDFVPIESETLAHPEDYRGAPRYLRDRRVIPDVPFEVMTDGQLISSLSAGFLEDLGWIVDHGTVDSRPRGTVVASGC